MSSKEEIGIIITELMQHHVNFRNFVVEYIIEATRQALDNEEEPIYPVLHAFMKKIGLEVSDVFIDQISMKSPRCSCRVKISALEFDEEVDGKASCDCGQEFSYKIRVRVE